MREGYSGIEIARFAAVSANLASSLKNFTVLNELARSAVSSHACPRTIGC